MSIETFFSQNKPGIDFKNFIQERVAKEVEQNGHPITPLNMLAQLYRREGSERIKAITRKLSETEGNRMTVPDQNYVLSQLTNEECLSWGRNGLAVFFGSAVPTIYSATTEGWLDMSTFWGFYDIAKAGTFLPEFPKREVELVIFEPRQWGALDQAARSNPNYAIFLNQIGLDLLPQNLASILRETYKAYEPAVQQFKTDHIRLASSL